MRVQRELGNSSLLIRRLENNTGKNSPSNERSILPYKYFVEHLVNTNKAAELNPGNTGNRSRPKTEADRRTKIGTEARLGETCFGRQRKSQHLSRKPNEAVTSTQPKLGRRLHVRSQRKNRVGCYRPLNHCRAQRRSAPRPKSAPERKKIDPKIKRETERKPERCAPSEANFGLEN
jgi:hypothetical protein